MSDTQLDPLPQIHIPGVSADAPPTPPTVVHHVFILDASGSMLRLRQSTITGFNEQVQNIRQLMRDLPNQSNYVTLVVFNGRAEERYFDIPADGIQEISEADYVPDGSTRLYGTVGQTLKHLEEHLGAERLRQERVVVTIITDGENTDHTEGWGQVSLRRYVEKLQQDHRWVITFIGTNINAAVEAESIGVPVSNTMQFTASSEGTRAMFAAAASARSSYMTRLSSLTPEQQAVTVDTFYSADRSKGLDLTGGTGVSGVVSADKRAQIMSQVANHRAASRARGTTLDDLATTVRMLRAVDVPSGLPHPDEGLISYKEPEPIEP